MKLFYVNCVITHPVPVRLFAKLKSLGIEAHNMVKTGERITLDIPLTELSRLRRICREQGADIEVAGQGAAVRILRAAAARAGLIAGAAVCIAAALAASRFVISIRVLSDDEQICEGVRNMLSECGVRPLTYIPSIDLAKTERALKQNVEGISWAGISLTDSTVIVDVIENVAQPENAAGRLPSNLVAVRDAVVEDIELYDGRLVTTIGSGVVRGQTLVSGVIERERTVIKDGEQVSEKSVKYVRSLGAVYGVYTQKQVFEQPFCDRRIIKSGEVTDRRFLRFFSLDIPLFFSPVEGFYTESESFCPFEILGEETPVGVRTLEYEKYSFETVVYSKEQAAALADRSRRIYEENFLSEQSGCEIRSRDISVSYSDSAAVVTAVYEVYGKISEESAFFMKK